MPDCARQWKRDLNHFNSNATSAPSHNSCQLFNGMVRPTPFDLKFEDN